MEKVRDSQFDNIKAILIFLVVLGHIISHFASSDQAAILYKIIFSFHMPAFLFISGYFAKFNPKKVFSTLFPLYILFQLIQIFETSFINWFQTGAPGKLSIDIFAPKWTMWYLIALMIYQLLIPVFDTENRKKQVGFLLLTMALGFLIGFTSNIGDIFALSKIIVFLPFFLLGYYEHKNGILRSFANGRFSKPAKLLSAVIGVLLVLFFCRFWNHIPNEWLYKFGSYTDRTSMFFRIALYVIAFLWIMILLIWIPKRPLGYIGTIGKNTLSVYLLHSIVILLIAATPLAAFIGKNMLTLILTSAILTLILSWNWFEKVIRKIRIPYTEESTPKIH